MKSHQVLKFYMKVNIYDQENVQKGRMMLLNLAEDLKEDCRIIVAPVASKRVDQNDQNEKKPETMEDVEKAMDKASTVDSKNMFDDENASSKAGKS